MTGEPDPERLPRPVLAANGDWLELYEAAWRIAGTRIRQGNSSNGFVAAYMDEGFSKRIFQWDTIFMALFGRYSNGSFPSIVSLENFYRKQHDDGFIDRQLYESDGKDFWGPDHPSAVNPPLFSWAEWREFLLTADCERFSKPVNGRTIFQRLADYFDWVKQHRRWENGFYWTTAYASGMDNSPRLGVRGIHDNARGHWLDLTAQQAINAYYMARIADVVGDENARSRFEAEYRSLEELINRHMWDEADGLYYDLDSQGRFHKVKTPASFWPLVARVATADQARRMVEEHLTNPEEFWRPHPVPSLAADEPQYAPEGRYWRGSVWSPTLYMVVEGLMIYGYEEIAREIAEKHLSHLSAVYAETGTLWENYAPDSASRGSQARPDFVGWTGLGPISLLIEQVIGLRVDAPASAITWNMSRTDRHGIENLRFRDGMVSLVAAARRHAGLAPEISVNTDRPFTLELKYDGRAYAREVPSGASTLRFGPD